MATIGLSKPYFAKYVNSGGSVSYQNGGLLAKAIEFGAQIDSGESNDLYADNGVAESDRSFQGGTMTMTTDDLTQEASAALLGITPVTISVNGVNVQELIYDDQMTVPDLGIGVIIKKKKDGAYKYRAVVLTKVKFNIPDESATTQGETIEWQTPELSGLIQRDDSTYHAWKREATFDTEQDARDYIEEVLNIAIGSLTVLSEAGLVIGNTEITVTPELTVGHSYKYKTGTDLELPDVYDPIGAGYTAWNGTDEITATTGDDILIVEVDANSEARKAGIATVVSLSE